MKFALKEDFIGLFKLLKVMGNGEVETRKRAKIVSGERIEVGGEVIEIESI